MPPPPSTQCKRPREQRQRTQTLFPGPDGADSLPTALAPPPAPASPGKKGKDSAHHQQHSERDQPGAETHALYGPRRPHVSARADVIKARPERGGVRRPRDAEDGRGLL